MPLQVPFTSLNFFTGYSGTGLQGWNPEAVVEGRSPQTQISLRVPLSSPLLPGCGTGLHLQIEPREGGKEGGAEGARCYKAQGRGAGGPPRRDRAGPSRAKPSQARPAAGAAAGLGALDTAPGRP